MSMEEGHIPSLQGYFRGHAEQEGRVFQMGSGLQINAEKVNVSDILQATAFEGLTSYAPKPIASADPLNFGVHRSEANHNGKMPEYVVRTRDAELRRRVSEIHLQGGFVLVVGDSTAGKTRSAFEALLATCPDSKIWAPIDGPDLIRNLRKVVDAQDGCFLWLDDLERYIGPDGLNPTVFSVMEQCKIRTIGTMRAEQYRRLSPSDGDPRSFDDMAKHNALGSRVLDQLDTVVLPRLWNETELARASEVKDSRVSGALAHSRLFGVAEYLAAGPRLYQEWSLAGGPDGNPRGASLVAAAVDLARSGVTGEVPLSVLLELHETYLDRAGGDILRPESIADALEWATRRRYGVTSLLLPIKAGSHYRVFDYLPDALARTSEAARIPKETWESALEYARLARLSFHVGMAAVQYENWDVAEKAWADDLEKHPITARVNLGRVYLKLAKIDQAKSIWQQAVDLGSIPASIYLGSEYEREGHVRRAVDLFRIGAEKGDSHSIYHLAYALPDDKEAIKWWLHIAESDTTDTNGGAAHNLAQTYSHLGDTQSSKKWWEIGAKRGNAWAMNNLGVALRKEGDPESALNWFKKAASKDNHKALVNWAELVSKQGHKDRAIEMLERAAALGEMSAYNRLGVLSLDEGDTQVAEAHWRTGYEAGDPRCALNLAIHLEDHNDSAGAGEAYLKASAEGGEAASFHYAFWLAKHGDPEEAEIYFRKALPIVRPGDICDFGRMLVDREFYARALNWMNLALLKGHMHAGCVTGQILIRTGKFADGERLLALALTDGHKHAGTVLSTWLVRTGRGAAAAQVMRLTQAGTEPRHRARRATPKNRRKSKRKR
ncbi:tetratricopeptide repeat protein [Streptomyces sp. NPDC047803]|uniref:tetratricopeptide repeat protein n=1 Tax=Streptomyces sp. NPDC047803 TaxID=3160976 RepID=UPI0033DDC923